MNYLITVFLLITANSYASRQMEQFLQANDHVQKKEYQKALDLYQSLEYQGPVVQYNKGVCHFYQKDYLDALVAFKQAQLSANFSLLKIIDNSLQELQKEIPVKKDSFLKKIAQYSNAAVSLLFLQLLTLIGSFCLVVTFYSKYFNKLVLKIVVVLFFISLLFITSLVWSLRTKKYAIVPEEISVYIGPDFDFAKKGMFEKYQQIEILTQLKVNQQEWYKVRKDAIVGWVPIEKVKTIA